MQQDTFLTDGSLTTAEAVTENRPSASGFRDSDVAGTVPPWGVLHCTRGSGYHPAEVHSSRAAPSSWTSTWT